MISFLALGEWLKTTRLIAFNGRSSMRLIRKFLCKRAPIRKDKNRNQKNEGIHKYDRIQWLTVSRFEPYLAARSSIGMVCSSWKKVHNVTLRYKGRVSCYIFCLWYPPSWPPVWAHWDHSPYPLPSPLSAKDQRLPNKQINSLEGEQFEKLHRTFREAMLKPRKWLQKSELQVCGGKNYDIYE